MLRAAKVDTYRSTHRLGMLKALRMMGALDQRVPMVRSASHLVTTGHGERSVNLFFMEEGLHRMAVELLRPS